MISKSHLRQYYAAFSCHLSGSMAGCAFVWFTPLMVRLLGPDSEVPMSYGELSWIVALMELGELITPLPAGLLANKWGRKWLLLSSAGLSVVSWMLTALTRSVEVLYLVRIINGCAAGIVLTLNPMYVAEISENSIRGELCGHSKTFTNLGGLYAYSVGPWLSYTYYACACSILSFLFFFTFLFMPESPYFLLMDGRKEEALKSLRWLRASDNVQEEFISIQETVIQDTEKGKSSLSELFATKESRRALFILSTVILIKYFGGSTAVSSYSTKTFSESITYIPADYITIAMGVLFTVTTFFASYLSDSVGRKPLLLGSSFGLTVFSFIIGLYYYLERIALVDLAGYDFMLYLSLIGYCITVSLGVNPVLPAIQAEYFTSNTRGPAGALSTIFGTLLVFLSLKQYQIIDESIGVYGNFIIFCTVCMAGFTIILTGMKESAGKPLGDVQKQRKISS